MNVTREVVVLIVEDDPGHVRLIQRNLERAGLHNPIEVFQNGQEVLDFLLGRGSGRKREPDTPYLLLLDVRMPQVDGVEVLRQVKRVLPKVHVIILSMHANEAYVLEALTHGASGFVLKDSSVADLVRAVREAVAGRRYLSPPLTERAIQAYAEKARAGVREPFDELTAREREVLLLAAEGNTNAEIGRKLFISTRTVETHRANAMHKLNLHSHTALVRYVVERHLVPASDDDLSESTTESAS